MSLKAVWLFFKAAYFILEYYIDMFAYIIFGIGDLEEEPVAGKVAIVTGSNTGIGKQVAKDLADRGATVILACRNLAAGQRAVDEIRATVSLAKVELMELDLSDLKSVRRFAAEVKARFPEINLLINNAGVCSYKPELQKTGDGFELHMGVNHLGHFLLTNLLLDNLKAGAPSRVVTVSSSQATLAYLKKDDLRMENFKNPTALIGITRLPYNNSKLANALFSKELARRLEGTGVTTYCLCPGIVKTDVFRDCTDSLKIIPKIVVPMGGLSAEKASPGILYCALSRKCEHETGKFYRYGQVHKRLNRLAKIKEAEDFWQISENLVQLKR